MLKQPDLIYSYKINNKYRIEEQGITNVQIKI